MPAGPAQSWTVGVAIVPVAVPRRSGWQCSAEAGTLPPGIQFDASRDEIVGTPSEVGSGEIRIRCSLSFRGTEINNETWTYAYTVSATAPDPGPPDPGPDPTPPAGQSIALATVDTAGGLIGNSLGVASTIDGSPIAVAGDSVAPHAPCPRIPIHCTAVTTASANSTINGIRIVLAGDAATCGHGATGAAASTIT